MPTVADVSPSRRSFASVVTGVTTAVVLFVPLLGINALQMLSLVLRPFSGRAFRRFNRWCADTFWGWCAARTTGSLGTEVIFTGDRPRDENAVVVSNHQTMVDIIALFQVAEGPGRLGDLKFFVKDVLKWVPGIGWGMVFLDCIFLKRNWTDDRDSIRRTFARILDHDVPIWLVSYVEGTRLTTAKLELARTFAAGRGLPVPRHVLVPRSKGFVASVTALREHLDAIYDVTIAYPDGTPGLWDWAAGRVRKVLIDVRRFATEDVPGELDLADWLAERFAAKDERLEYSARHGRLVESGVTDALSDRGSPERSG